MIPPAILSCERSPRFWTDLVAATSVESRRDGENFSTAYGSTSEPHQIDWSLPAGFGLRLQLSASLNTELFLVTPAGSALTLGWDDQAHWHAVSDATRLEIAKTLTDAGFRVALRPVPEGGDGLTITTETIDAESSATLWQVMRQHDLLLLPNLIAASKAATDQVEMHPERVIMIDAPNDLAETLRSTGRE